VASAPFAKCRRLVGRTRLFRLPEISERKVSRRATAGTQDMSVSKGRPEIRPAPGGFGIDQQNVEGVDFRHGALSNTLRIDVALNGLSRALSMIHGE
jgi:hypothetical protein